MGKQRNTLVTSAPPPSTQVRTATWGAQVAVFIRTQVFEWSLNIIVLLFAWTSVMQAFVVPSGSMKTTIMTGDHLFVDKLAYSPAGGISKYLLPYTPVKRGDIICFTYPVDTKQTYVKRVIGVPGDRVHITDKQVYINGKAAVEPYKQHIRNGSLPYLANFPDTPPYYVYDRGRDFVNRYTKDGELVIPEGFYFAMGDNRDNSEDSRFWGLVPRENILGKPVLVWWSYDAPTAELLSPLPTASHTLDMLLHFPQKTRWERTFHLLRGQDPLSAAK